MKRSLRTLILVAAALLLAAAPAAAQSGAVPGVFSKITLPLAQPPQMVPSGAAVVVGNPGPQTYYYWVVSDYVIGNSSPAGPFSVANAPNILSATNYDQINWGTATGASSYDVLRTTTPTVPAGACNCAVETTVIGNSAEDQSNTLLAYTVNTLDPSTLSWTVTALPKSKGVSELEFFANGNQAWTADSTGALHAKSIEQVRFANEWCSTPGTLDQSCIANAIESLPSAGGIIYVPPGTYAVSATVTVPSGVTIEGAGAPTVLSAAPVLSGEAISLTGTAPVVRNLLMQGNNLAIAAIQVEATNATVAGVHIVYFAGGGINVVGPSANITIARCTVDHGGPASVFGGVDYDVFALNGNVTGVTFLDDQSDNSNYGFYVEASNSASPGPYTESDLKFIGDTAYSEFGDGFGLYAGAATGWGPITDVLFSGDTAYCNGYVPGETSPNCPAGYRQTGSVASYGGVGINLNSATQSGIRVVGAYVHDNSFEGVANTPQRVSVVNLSGTTCTWVSGDPFLTTWPADASVLIGGANYPISSVQSATSMTVTVSGSATDATMTGLAFSSTSISDSESDNNGWGEDGSGFSQIGAIGSSYVADTAEDNYFPGFFAASGANDKWIGDTAANNDRGGTSGTNGGFNVDGCVGCQLVGIAAADNTGFQYQAYPVFLTSNDYNTLVSSFALTADGNDNQVLTNGSTNTLAFTQAGLRTPMTFSNTGTPVCLDAEGGSAGCDYLPTSGVGLLALASQLPLTGATSTIGGSALAAGACTTGTAAIANSTTSMVVAVSPSADPGTGIVWEGWISADGTATVRVCNVTPSSVTPAAETYNVRAIR